MANSELWLVEVRDKRVRESEWEFVREQRGLIDVQSPAVLTTWQGPNYEYRAIRYLRAVAESPCQK